MQIKDLCRFTCGMTVAALLSACGGTDTPATPSTLSGTAAVGLPIVGGDINVTCAGGAAIIQPKLTNTSGQWTVTLAGQTLPCAVQVTAGNIGSATGAVNSTSYHSIAMSLGTVNITPLTDLVVANMAGKDPATWFTSPNLAALKAADIDTALGKIKTAWGLSAALGTQNPITSSFTATTTDPLDKALDALAKASKSSRWSYDPRCPFAICNQCHDHDTQWLQLRKSIRRNFDRWQQRHGKLHDG